MASDRPRSADCIFCKIVAGEIPSHTLLDEDEVLAFLDIGPLSRGHVLLIPKGHYETVDALPEATAAACGSVLPRISRALVAATRAPAWNVLQNNGALAHQAVGHVHFHLIPKYEDGSGLGIAWPAGRLDEDDAKALVAAITEEL